MSGDVLVRVENVSKRFCRSLKRSLWYGLQDLGSELGGRRHGGGAGLPQSSTDVQLRPDEFWAVKDVSFELRRGECLGLIGRNGAGKTTLLRLLNGLIKPDTGNIEMKGNIGALIALGAGFNPILTGRENIQITCGIAGIDSRQIIEDIIDFSELHDFIDMPLQSYSSGMAVRLGFAANIMITPDILILDEVLAVGDASFRAKCYQKIQQHIARAATLLVSHDSGQLQKVCSHGLLLSKGQSFGKMALLNALNEYESMKSKIQRLPSSAIFIRDPNISRCNIDLRFSAENTLYIDITLTSAASLQIQHYELNIVNMSYEVVANCTKPSKIHLKQGRDCQFSLVIMQLALSTGEYFVNVVLYGYQNTVVLHHAYQMKFAVESRPAMWNCHYQPVVDVNVNKTSQE